MAATNGSAIFLGRGGRTYVKDLYFSDSNGARVNFDNGQAAAGSTGPDYWNPPEPVVLKDLSVITGAGITGIRLFDAGKSTGDRIRLAIHLNTLNFRPILTIPFAGQITFVQET